MKKICLALIVLFLCTACTGVLKKEYYCDSGDELKGTSCIKKNRTPATPKYACPQSVITTLEISPP